MRKSAKKALVLVVGVIVALMLFAGCEEENQSDTKASTTRSRFIANENRQLKEKIKELKQQHKRETKRWENLLAKCQKEKETIAELSAGGFKDFLDSALQKVPEELARLNEENQSLKAKIGQLKKEILQLKRELERHEGPTPLESGAN